MLLYSCSLVSFFSDKIFAKGNKLHIQLLPIAMAAMMIVIMHVMSKVITLCTKIKDEAAFFQKNTYDWLA